MTLRKLFDAVMGEPQNTKIVSENRNKLYSELSEILNYAGIQCNRLNIQEVRAGGVYIHVVVRRGENLPGETIGGDYHPPKRSEVIRTHVLPSLLLDLEAPFPIAQYWCLKQNLKEAVRETKERAESLKRAQFKEFEAEITLEDFKRKAEDADVLIFQKLEAL